MFWRSSWRVPFENVYKTSRLVQWIIHFLRFFENRTQIQSFIEIAAASIFDNVQWFSTISTRSAHKNKNYLAFPSGKGVHFAHWKWSLSSHYLDDGCCSTIDVVFTSQCDATILCNGYDDDVMREEYEAYPHSTRELVMPWKFPNRVISLLWRTLCV